jgi:thiosulfate reductase cytochrome b subunit
MSILRVPAACPCYMSLLHVRAVCTYMLHVLVACLLHFSVIILFTGLFSDALAE